MNSTAVTSSFGKTGPDWRYRLESIPLRRLRGFVLAAILVGTAGVLAAVNLAAAPTRHATEGTLVRRAWVVETTGSFGRVTDWYDHPPLGWLVLSGWTAVTGAFERAPSAVAAGRELALVAQVVTLALLWILARRMRLARGAAALAVAVAGLSPLAVELHRQVTLENLAVPWILGAFVLACSPRRRLAAVAACGACLGAAVLTHEAAMLLVPFVAWQVARSGLPSTRRYALVVAGSVFGMVIGAYVVATALSGELVAGADHAGLWDGIRSQLAVRPPLTSAPFVGASPFDVDPLLLVALLVAAPAALVTVPRLRPVAAGSLVLLLLAVGPGDVRPALVVTALPLGAVVLAGLADAGWRHRPTAGAPTRAVWAAVGAAVGTVAVVGWIGEHHRLLTADADEPLDNAEAWLVANVPHDRGLIVDDAVWVDLAEAGFPVDRLAGYHQLAIDPGVGPQPTGRWDQYRLLVVTESLRASDHLGPVVDEALQHSVALAVFGTDREQVEIRTIVADGPISAAHANDHDRVAAASAGEALARNRSIELTPGASAALVDGEVDQRLMTTLVALALDTPLRVTSFSADPAEAATGAPRRTVVIEVGSDADARSLADLLAHQAPPYRPHLVDLGSDRTLTITYRPAAVI